MPLIDSFHADKYFITLRCSVELGAGASLHDIKLRDEPDKRIEQRIEQQPKRIEQAQRKVTKSYKKKKPGTRMNTGISGEKL